MTTEKLMMKLLKEPFLDVCNIGKAAKKTVLEKAMELLNSEDAAVRTKNALEYLSEDAEDWEDLNDVLDKNNVPFVIYAADVFCHYDLPGDLLQMWVEEFFFEKSDWQKQYKKAETMARKKEAVYQSVKEFCNF